MPENSKTTDFRFRLVYSKMAEVLGDGGEADESIASVVDPVGDQISREELDEIARFREVVMETSYSEPISFTTT